jgi:hypothetical protein
MIRRSPLAGLVAAAAASALAAPALATTAGSAPTAVPHARPASPPPGVERLVVRGEDTVADGRCGPDGCLMRLTGGTFRGTAGEGRYGGTVTVVVAESFPNGEDGVCAPLRGRIRFDAGARGRLRVALAGISCQDGHGPVTAAAFSTVVRFTVAGGTGAYRHVRGSGIGTFAEDAADHEHVTLIGRIARQR